MNMIDIKCFRWLLGKQEILMNASSKIKIEVYRSGKEWRFRIKARNNKIIAVGESYKRKTSLYKTLDLILSLNKRNTEIVEIDT